MRLPIAMALACTALLLAAGCPERGDEPAEKAQAAKPPAAEPLSPESLDKLSLFNVQGMDGVIPFSVDINRLGTLLYTQFKIKGSTALNTACFNLKDGKLEFNTGLAGLPEVTRPYVDSAPVEIKCLTIGNYQTEQSRVNDRVYIADDTMAQIVEFEQAAGIPADRPFDDFYNLSPFYSWDGQAVIVPLKYSGVVIRYLDNPGYLYVDYPEFAELATGMELHALPDQNDKRRIFASIWQAGLYEGEDDCRLFTLDLDNPEWHEVAQLNWIVYQAGGADLDNEPWVIAGSRGKETAAETKRQPLHGLLDPASGVIEVLRSFGEPVWQIEVEPYGKYVMYLDRQRQALVRLDPHSGALDYDPRWFNEDARIICNSGGEVVLTWFRNILLAAEWSGHEQHDGPAG